MNQLIENKNLSENIGGGDKFLIKDREGINMRPPMPMLPEKDRIYLLKLASFFTVADGPGDTRITEGQLRIFGSIILRRHKRVQIICSTQYGKSLWVALASIVLSCIFGKVVVIVAPSTAKAKIIMRYFIEHLSDSPLFYTKLEKNTKLERLKQEENKERIILNNGGGIFVVSTDEKNSQKSIESAMGQGAEIVIGDEFCLVSDNTEATIFRMIAGKGPDACYVKIGNPFYSAPPNSHFLKTWLEINTYHRIYIDYKVALEEGRLQPDFIEQAKSKPLFDILFGCTFPDLSVMDAKGYRLLLLPEQIKFGATPEKIKEAIKKHKADNNGVLVLKPKLGCDIGGGGDKNVFVLRFMNLACVVATNISSDTMSNVSEIQRLIKEYEILAEDVNVDDIGIGRGVTDRLIELGIGVNPVTAGNTAMFGPDKFSNLKAEMCWDAKIWVSNANNLLDNRQEWVQLTWLKYKTQSDKKIIMEPKDELKKRTHKSPDFAEAFYLTFASMPFVGFI